MADCEVKARDLHDALTTLGPVGDKSAPVRLTFTAGNLLVEAQFVGRFGEVDVPTTSGNGTGQVFAMPALLKRAEGRGGVVRLEVADTALAVHRGDAKVTARCVPEEWVPTPAVDGTGFEVESAVLAAVLPAASNDDGRPILEQVAVESEYVVATDSYRLHAHPVDLDVLVNDAGKRQVLLPAFVLRPLVKVASKVKVVFDGNGTFLRLEGGPVRFTVKTYQGAYPGWKLFDKRASPTTLTVDRPALLAALRHCLTISSWYPYPVHFKPVPNGVRLHRGPTTGEWALEQAIPCQWTGGPFVFAFNGPYLADAVNAGYGPTVTFGLSSAILPATVSDDSPCRRLLMPVRL